LTRIGAPRSKSLFSEPRSPLLRRGGKSKRWRTSAWHYVNIPTSQPSFDEKRDGNDKNNVIDRTDAFEHLLADRTKPREARVEALKFLVHLVADLHQPLHCANRADRGRIDTKVRMPGSRAINNLHAVWDTTLLRGYIGDTRTLEYAKQLNARIDEQPGQKWQEGGPEELANEAHQIAVDAAYNGVPQQEEPVALNDEYVKINQPIIERQLQSGGIRLAMMLNRCLSAADKK